MSPTSLKAKATAACAALGALLPAQVYWPNSDEYTTASTEIWSKTCVLAPECVFEPLTARDLGDGIKLIREHGSKFAVRSGGHMPNPGAQSVGDDGVMVSMSRFDGRSLSGDKSVLSIGPGQRWGEVYDWLAPHGLAVNGGRYPMVGVGGVLVGGGIGYFAGERGWSVDDVVAWQVVLADGSMVEVTTAEGDPFEDLAWALRGGHNYFGIVTRFDMRTFAVGPAYGGLTVYGSMAKTTYFDAVDAYMAPGGGADDPRSAINAITTLQRADGTGEWHYGYISAHMYNGDDPSPRALENFTAIPAEHVVMDGSGLHREWTAIPNMMNWIESRDSRQLFWEITFRADRRAVDIAHEVFLDSARNELSDVEALTMVVSLQPLTRPWLRASKAKGGNLLGLDPDKDAGSFATMIISTWQNARDDEAVLAFTQKASKIIEEKLKKLDLFNPFVYLNDAGRDQKPFESYAGGANLPRLRAIQAKYDKDAFLKDYLQHGVELSSQVSEHEEL